MNETATPSPETERSTAFLTDMYELTMLDAAIKDGTAERNCTFEVFGRRTVSYTHLTLPTNREV